MSKIAKVTCVKCGWVHMAYTRQQAQEEVDQFNAFYDSAPPETQAHYGGRSSLARYERCWCGANEFRPYRHGDYPIGCTIGPVIAENVRAS